MTRARVIVAAALAGLAVLTVAIAYLALNQTGVTRLVGFQRFGDDRGIVVIVQLGAGMEIAERQIEERSDAVKVTVHVRRPSGAVPGYLIVVPIPVQLHAVLGSRRVLDYDGAPVTDLGVYQAPLPTPAGP